MELKSFYTGKETADKQRATNQMGDNVCKQQLW